jgi:hypothetical protein
MSTTSTESNTSMAALPLRKSLAVLLLGVVALVASFNLEHNRHIQQGLSGQIESIPDADIALLLHKESVLQRLAASAAAGNTDSNDGKDKKSSLWLALVAVDLTFYGALANEFVTASPSLFYASPRAQAYSARAPPRI